jgi:murein DD-endopeptidase
MVSNFEYRRSEYLLALLLACAALTACASAPSARSPSAAAPAGGTRLAEPAPLQLRGLAIAHDMVGAPYRYGGSSPRGFDCSGLVYYSYREAGLQVPRTTGEQYRQSERISLASLQRGDLLFFRISRAKISHVGIYAGDGRFIHAPSGGKQVSYASLNDPYWKSRVIGAGRF